jgi:hypothetical protein
LNWVSLFQIKLFYITLSDGPSSPCSAYPHHIQTAAALSARTPKRLKKKKRKKKQTKKKKKRKKTGSHLLAMVQTHEIVASQPHTLG